MKVTLSIKTPKTTNYAVKGKDYTEAAEYLLSKPFSACYDAHPDYDYDFDGDKVTSITVKAVPTITMPNWSGASKLKDDEKKWWNAMMKALDKHEKNHHDKWVKSAEDFKKAREKAGDFPKKDIAKTMNAFFAEAQKVQDKYDSQTNHGEKEGVTLPV